MAEPLSCVITPSLRHSTAIKLISRSLLDTLAIKAAASPRHRAHHNIHEAAEDVVQRFFVVGDRDTYFRPHRHLTKAELAVVLRGRFDVLTFDDAGKVTARYSIGEDSQEFAYELPPATWHTLLACTDGSTFLEIKQGPYDPATAAQFASWAPAEGDTQVPEFLDWLRDAQPGTCVPTLGS